MTTTRGMSWKPGLSNVRVAVSDDVPEVARSTARVLKAEGADVDVFGDATHALEAHEHSRYDVIVSDVVMPGVDGVEFLRSVRNFDSDVPVVLFSGTPTIDTARQALELGAFRYLTKPFSSEELCEAVRLAARSSKAPPDPRGTEARELDLAIEALWMAYQPIVHARDGTVFGYEALMRTEHRAFPHPGAILDAAERLGRLTDVGRAVRSLAPKPLPRLAPEQVLFVNVHPRDLMDPELTSPDATLSGVADRVVLEITERAALEMVRDLLDTIAALRQRGFRIAVDDLGSGFAGLTSFAVLEPDIVKLDMALIRDVDTSTTKQKLVKSVVDLCHDLGVVVVGEGVETFAERAMCASLGVDLLQGFLLARPGRPFPEVTW